MPTETATVAQASWVEDFSRYKRVYKEARAQRTNGIDPLSKEFVPAPQLSGVPDDFRFGMELEFNAERGVSPVLRQLRDASLINQSRIRSYHHAASHRWQHWVLEQDGSVDGELVSQILSDTEQSWAQVLAAVNSITAGGGSADANNVGGHISCNFSILGNPVENERTWRTFTGILLAFEDIMWRLAANPYRGWSAGVNRHGVQRSNLRRRTYSSPLSRSLVSFDVVRVGNFNTLMGHLPTRGGDVSLRSWSRLSPPTSCRMEWRMWDGSLNPHLLALRVKIMAAIMKAARREDAQDMILSGDIAECPVGFHRAAAARATREDGESTGRALRGEAWREDTLRFRQFLDLIFPDDNETATSVAELFALNSWNFSR